MDIKSLTDISFDEQDANLFLVDDARLRADALKHSVLPRLRVVMNVAISLIREIYEIEVLEDSIVSVYPNFRQKRENELRLHYDSAFVGLGGQRKAKWPGFSRKDGKPVQILPFRFAFKLTQDGLFTVLENGWLKGLDNKSSEALLRFHIENESIINPLCFHSGICPEVGWSEKLPILSSFQEHYRCCIDNLIFDSDFFGHSYHFPISELQLAELVYNFACFFPVYDSYIQIAKGFPPRIDSLIVKLRNWLQQVSGNNGNEAEPEESDSGSDEVNTLAALAAETKVRVMPAIRWQVFQRDRWKCVSCGRTSHDEAILHIDHIIPRSRGGLDSIDNYQTLCDVCNIGKSNRDATDLRCRSGLGVLK